MSEARSHAVEARKCAVEARRHARLAGYFALVAVSCWAVCLVLAIWVLWTP